MIRFKVQSDKRSILVLSKALLLYILLQELHEGGLGLVKSLDHQTPGLVHLKETKGLVSSRLVHLYFFNLSLALGSAVPIARVKWTCLFQTSVRSSVMADVPGLYLVVKYS